MYRITVWDQVETIQANKGLEWLFEYESDAIDQIYSNIKNYISLFLDIRTPFKLKSSTVKSDSMDYFGNLYRYGIDVVWEKNNTSMIQSYFSLRLPSQDPKAFKEAEEKHHKLELFTLNGLLYSRFEDIKFKTIPQNIKETKELLDLFYTSVQRINMDNIMFNVPTTYEIEDLTNIVKMNESIPRLV
jgi:hypothetical protein